MDEKNHVARNANKELKKQMQRLSTAYSFVQGELTDEARLGSLTHWAYVQKTAGKATAAGGGSERPKRETTLQGGDGKRDAVGARKQRRNQIEPEADYGRARKGQAGAKAKAGDAGSHDRGAAAATGTSAAGGGAAKRRKVEKQPQAAAPTSAAMERSASTNTTTGRAGAKDSAANATDAAKRKSRATTNAAATTTASTTTTQRKRYVSDSPMSNKEGPQRPKKRKRKEETQDAPETVAEEGSDKGPSKRVVQTDDAESMKRTETMRNGEEVESGETRKIIILRFSLKSMDVFAR